MQKIFFNANIITFDEKLPLAQALLTNDENIVFVGENKEVLDMKTETTELIDLNGKTVIPSFFDTNARIYELIEKRLRENNKEKFLENNDEIDENYEKFENYSEYKNEFLKIQDEYIGLGITTVFEMGIKNKEFIFWKKISEEKALKIDVIAFIDIISSKDVMDNNCRTYRKYKDHFRLGGYLFRVDGKLSEKKSWISKKYKGEITYKGYTNLVDEQLSFLIKTALEEKKQVVVETNGDEALSQFIRCFEENIKDKNDDEKFRPIAKNCNFASKKQIKEMKNAGICPSFEINEIENSGKRYIEILGKMRSKKVQPINEFIKNNVPFLLNSSTIEPFNIFHLINIATHREYENKRVLGKKQIISFDSAIYSMIKNSALFAYDSGFKGSLENGYRADFLVLDNSLSEIFTNKIENPIFCVYIDGELTYKKALN